MITGKFNAIEEIGIEGKIIAVRVASTATDTEHKSRVTNLLKRH